MRKRVVRREKAMDLIKTNSITLNGPIAAVPSWMEEGKETRKGKLIESHWSG